MKNIFLLLAVGLISTTSIAQNKKSDRTIHIVAKTDNNGKVSKIDTVIDLDELEDQLETKLKSMDIDSLIESVGISMAQGWEELSEDLQNMELDVVINGERTELDDLEDAMKWVGEAMEDVHFEFSDDEDHIFITNGKKGKQKTRIIVDENSDEGASVQNEFIDIDLDDKGKGKVIVRSSGGGSNENVNIWIDDDGQVTVNGKGKNDASVRTKVKVVELEDDNIFISDSDQDNVDVKVIKDKNGNTETKVLVKTITRGSDPDFKDAPELPNGLSLQVYPNPNNGSFQLTFRNEKKAKTEIVVYDGKGTEVFRKLIGKVVGESKHVVDLEHLKSGTYILKLNQGKNANSQQFVIR